MRATHRKIALDKTPLRADTPESIGRGPRSALTLGLLGVCALFVFAALVALGTWQVERRAWKLDLIERVEQRVHAPAVDAPGPERWPLLGAATDEYRRVRVTGRFLTGRDTLVQASTELGAGYWLITPMKMRDGRIVLVNRGFVPPEWRSRQAPPEAQAGQGDRAGEAAELSLTGLLRMSEPGGGFLRHNDPAADRWYSRDIAAIAAARGLGEVAPYFVDADADADADAGAARGPEATPGQAALAGPVGGLTVIAFHNNHLVYAITWYLLAAMVAVAAWYVGREELRLRRRYTPR